MAEIIFKSGLKSELTAFLDHKRKLGTPYRSGAYYLADFDKHCLDKYPDCNQLLRDICLSWAVRRPSENASGFASRVTPVRQFGKYLVRLGYDAFVLPDQLGGHSSRPLPHIFTMYEIGRFFAAADNMERYYQSVVRHYVAPLMFRYLYCCGLRPREARRIYMQDVNLETGKLFIRESKGFRERIVVLSPALVDLTKAYLCELNAIFKDSEFLFPDRYGAGMSYDSQNYLFELCIANSGISSPIKPTLYSFRHSYATHRLYTWIREKQDILVMLPYLSAFMGHSDFDCTYCYIHLIPDMFQELSAMDMSQFDTLIPEVTAE